MSFHGDADVTWIALDFPYREEPRSYSSWRSFAADLPTTRLYAGESARFEFRVFVALRDLHAYAAPLREMSMELARASPLAPWLGASEAAPLAAHGLLAWHYDERLGIIRDTVAFDPITSSIAGGRDSAPLMSVAWAGGMPCAFALLRHGRGSGAERSLRAGLRVIETILDAESPAGMLRTMWREGCGWEAPAGQDDGPCHSRIVAEAILYLLRAYLAEESSGIPHPEWREIVETNLAFAVSRQRGDGNFGYAYAAATGAVTEWDGCGGLVWVAALAEASRALGERSWLDAAVHGGEYYARFVLDQHLYGAPSDVYLTPTSEDGYNAVLAYVALFESDPAERWLTLARRAADWMLTFRFSYNVVFPEHTILRDYGYRTRGGDVASPCNQHVHNYGLVCLPEMLRLAEYAGDPYYRRRALENLACSLQFIARADGDFNAGKGMVSEQWYHTDWWRPKGSLLALSHSWCIALILIAAMHARERGVDFSQERL